MANALYDNAREGFLVGRFNWGTGAGGDVFKAILVDTGAYTVNLSSHQYKSSIAGGAIIAGPVTLAGKATTSGAADADDVTFSAVTGTSIEAIVIYRFVTNDADSDLIAYIDTATGLPITPNGGDIIVTWDNGTNKIFKL